MFGDTRCNEFTEVLPGVSKRCIRPQEHIEKSCVWIEDITRSDGAPRIVIWSKDPVEKAMAYLIFPELVEEVDRIARAYGWEVGNGHVLVEEINELSDENPFMDPNWKENIIKMGG